MKIDYIDGLLFTKITIMNQGKSKTLENVVIDTGATRSIVSSKPTSIEDKLDHIYYAVVRLEGGISNDIINVLEDLHKKYDEKDAEIMALNRRVFWVESAIEKIGKQ